MTAPGVKYIVGIGRVPEPIDEREIQSLRTIVGSGLYYEPHPYLTTGQLVQVEQGSLVGLVGRVILQKNASRLIISIELLMRSVSTEIDRSWVKAVDIMSYKRHFQMQPAFTETSFGNTGMLAKPTLGDRRSI